MMGHSLHSSKLVVICVVLLLFVLFHVLFVCKCVLYYCHWVTTQLQLTHISYHLSFLARMVVWTEIVRKCWKVNAFSRLSSNSQLEVQAITMILLELCSNAYVAGAWQSSSQCYFWGGCIHVGCDAM